jgi:TRAP-type transport system periplasmic protein
MACVDFCVFEFYPRRQMMKSFSIRRSVLSLAAGAVLAAGFALPQVADAQNIQPRLIRFGYGLNENSNQGRAVKVFSEAVEKSSGGKMKVRAVGAAALGPDVQMQQALIGGAQEMMVGSTATLVGITKEMALWDTPFLFNNVQEADAILDGPIGKKVMDKLQEKGLVGLVYWENGFRNLTNTKRPVTKVEDLDGIKLRVMQNNVYLESFKILGANAVPMPFSELFTALETKAVDGQENPFNTILSSKFFEVQKYLSVTNHVYSPWIMLVSKKWWDGLSADEKKVLQDAAIASRDFERKDTREEAGRALGELKNKGMQINEVSPVETGRMRTRLTRVNATIAANVGMDLWIETQAALDKLRNSTTASVASNSKPAPAQKSKAAKN